MCAEMVEKIFVTTSLFMTLIKLAGFVSLFLPILNRLEENNISLNFMSCTSEKSSHPLLWKMANGKTFFQAPKNLRLLHHKLLSTAFDVLKSHL